ncbi:hypothetical protein A2810_03120 [candidate division Kazan bacterium RIFCSPHIGHO2_01_FULL_49_10]|uniref:Uncharacterized protein n=1 Tax=candidate division Kazan bacterium RIFCSPLOWO2_01_FULL_48_13 TaxID=1798539 RepID=A0A1F4PPG1_UNCK3|nr:MAG: hypothetical protein A2810_03120 [candidate division Kazan bacterium RIFCSPHIGHO2_01_FULL_49_10]OGB85505.1 MAG: hypothetical protein A2994_00565 [candidate division Kazan bacterium RIFCSPLOWO2_01_FULL_48_13]
MPKSSLTAGWASDSPTPAQLKELFAQIASGRITGAGLQSFLRGGAVATGGRITSFDIESQLNRWVLCYREEFKIACDLSGVKIPEHRNGFDRLVVVINDPAITTEQVFQRSKERFGGRASKWTVGVLDKTIDPDREIRNPNRDGTYVIWVRNNREADGEYRNKSANDIQRDRVNSTTLLERELLGLDYHRTTGEGEHLDCSSITLCAGSRCADGSVPYAYWFDGRLRVGRFYPDHAYVVLGVREVVSIRK